jgi:hypothetical protein
MSNKLSRILACIATAAFFAAAGPPVQAGNWGSHFDPLTFFGDGLFEVDDSCLLEDGIYYFPDCNVSLLAVTAELDDGSGGTGHLDFAPVLPSSDIWDIVISGGALVGVDTGLIGFVFPSSCSGDILCGNPWWIQWQSEFGDPVFLYTGDCFENEGFECFPNEFSSAEATNVTFTRVPEPGSLGLLLGALGAGWLTRRRKAAA